MHDDFIMDVGVHKGEVTEFYLKKGFRVVGIEGHPELYGIVKNRLKSYIDRGQLILLNVAIATADGPITFFINLDVSEWGTISQDWARRNVLLGTRSVPIIIQGCRFEEILHQFGIPYYIT